MKCFIIVSVLLHTVLAAPQFITFKDGKVGVNFFGYHAEAGLGGDQNGNGLFGGLHASAGTPFGQNAAAGLGGNVNGRAAGVLYAGAQATPDIGAGAILGGDTSRGGFSASEAYVPGKTTGHSRTTVVESTYHGSGENSAAPEYVTEGISAVQKIRPPKKFRNHDKKQLHSSFDGYDFTNLSAGKGQIVTNNPSASIFVAKTINKTTISTPLPTSTNSVRILNTASSPSSSSTSLSSAPSSSSSPSGLNGDLLVVDNSNHNHGIDAPPPSTIVLEESFEAPIIPTSTISLSPINDETLNDKSSVLIRQSTKTKLRNRPQVHPRPHAHRVRHQQRKLQKRINSNSQRQRSKTIVRIVEKQQMEEALSVQQQYDQNLPFESQQLTNPQNPPQQETVVVKTHEKRQLIAPQQSQSDEEPGNYHQQNRRSNHVVNALQIPVGILQSLQQSLGR